MGPKRSSRPNGEADTNKQKSERGLMSLLSNPVFGTLSFIIALVSLLLMIRFYSAGKLQRELKFYCHPVKTEIAKAGYSAPLEIFYNNEKVNEDITAFQIAVWNNGKMPIEKNDILEPIMLCTDPKASILDASIKKVTRDVIQLSIDKRYYKDGYVPVSWQILEKNDGGVIQLIVAGKPSVQISTRGIIKGQKPFEVLGQSIKIKGAQEQYMAEVKLASDAKKWIWIFPVMPISLALLFMIIIYHDIKKIARMLRSMKYSLLVFTFVGITLAVALYVYVLLTAIKAPPFSF